MNTIASIPLDKADALLNWATTNVTAPELLGDTPTGRFARWYGLGVDTSSGLADWKGWKPYEAEPITDGLKRLAAAIDPDMTFNSVLVYRYPSGVGIGRHVDKPIYEGEVTLLNLCKSSAPRELGLFEAMALEPDSIGFLYGVQRSPIPLYHGEAIRFNSRVEHGVQPTPAQMERVSIQFRSVNVG
jgi:hypothetical protein